MIGAVIITHGELAASLYDVAETITGEVSMVRTVALKGGEPTEDIRETLAKAVAGVDGKEGVLIFTDMFGGTPTNIALSLLEEGNVEVVTGVNLPILLKFLNNRGEMPFKELLEMLLDYGQKSVVLASNMLKGEA